MARVKCFLVIMMTLPALWFCLATDLPETFPEYKEYMRRLQNQTLTAPMKNKRFIISNDTTANWHRAERHCVSQNMHLASVTSQQEQDQLSSLMNKYGVGEAWIGATDLGGEGDFYWVSSGEALNYTAWSGGQPNDNSSVENCVEMFEDGFGWWDWDCDDPFHFVCETQALG